MSRHQHFSHYVYARSQEMLVQQIYHQSGVSISTMKGARRNFLVNKEG